MSPKIDPATVEAELQSLTALSLEALKARWLQLKGVPLPKFMRRGLMTLAVAHAIQEAAYGGLDPATQKRLDALAAQIVPSGQKPPPKSNKVKVGTRLIREWQGRVHEVTVVDGGFNWNGKDYRSLSVIAREITGTRWNGWVFFGLKRRPPKGDGAPLKKGHSQNQGSGAARYAPSGHGRSLGVGAPHVLANVGEKRSPERGDD